MVWTFIYIILWVLMAVGLSLIMALHLLLVWACPMFEPDMMESAAMTTKECFTFNIDGCEPPPPSHDFLLLCFAGWLSGCTASHLAQNNS
jgi:hypothetical protein